MAERPDAEPEGWHVPQRAPMIAAAVLPLLLLVLLAIAAHVYATHWEGERNRAPKIFPAPGIESYIHDGPLDPDRAPARPAPDPAIVAAKRAVVTQGIAGWHR